MNRNSAKKNKDFKQPKSQFKVKKVIQESSDEQSQTDEIVRENNRLRKQLLDLSNQLDVVLEKAATHKMKVSISPVIASTKESKQMELQNALKIIERLKKTVKDFEEKEAYEVSFKRITDLQSIVKKKEDEIQKLKSEIKAGNKSLKDQQRNVSELLQQQEVVVNVNENKQKIEQLKQKIKKLAKENQDLTKKDHEKQEKLFNAERKMQQLDWIDEKQIGRNQLLLDQLNHLKQQYKQTMSVVEKQNAQIIKLNLQISKKELERKKRPPKSYSYQESPRKVSKSLQELPRINKNRGGTSNLFDLPSLPRRY